MTQQRYWKTTGQKSRRSVLQGVQSVRAKRPALDKAVKVALRKRRREAKENYFGELSNASTKINEMAQELAGTHHKTLQCVQADLGIGGELLKKRQMKSNTWNAWL